MTFEIHTLRYGQHHWMTVCQNSLDQYASRHGYPIRVWDDTDRGYPSVKFCERDMLESFLNGDSDFMLYVDADVLIDENAPSFPMIPGFGMATDELHREHDLTWREWCLSHFSITVIPEFLYANAGVWVCDRPSARIMLEFFKPPFIEHFQEQHQWNLAAYLASTHGMTYHQLPQCWNHHWTLPSESTPWFVHLWGDNKDEALQKLT